jgi:hypothetical protein
MSVPYILRNHDLPWLSARLVANHHHLLFVQLAFVDQLFNAAGCKETVDLDISRLANSESSVHSLQIVCGVYNAVSKIKHHRLGINTPVGIY